MDALRTQNVSDNTNNTGNLAKGLDIEKLAVVLLKPENRDKVKELKRETNIRIEEINTSLSSHRRRIENAEAELIAAKTDLQSPRLILEQIAMHKRALQQARQIIERAERSIELLEAKLPEDTREEKVKCLESTIANEEKTIESLSSAKSFYGRIKKIVEEAEELRRLDG